MSTEGSSSQMVHLTDPSENAGQSSRQGVGQTGDDDDNLDEEFQQIFEASASSDGDDGK